MRDENGFEEISKIIGARAHIPKEAIYEIGVAYGNLPLRATIEASRKI